MKHEATTLLEWFDHNKRELPWRVDSDPYRVLVSEVMLQQTRVETVLRYYDRFLERFPDVETLAQAREEDVLAMWSGLGYYSRARRLKSAAEAIVSRGSFPRTSQDLLQLPGIGAYTASAVASIAFGEAVPVLDGNVERVVGRWIALEENPKRKAGREKLLDSAAQLLTESRPGDSNQALMELGATVCSPTRPQCLLCPLSPSCAGHAAGTPEAFPPRPERKKSERRFRLVAVAVDARYRVLLVRRSLDERWMPGLWELPFVDVDEPVRGRYKKKRLTALEESLNEHYGGRWSIRDKRASVSHGITHYRFSLEVRQCEVDFATDEVAELTHAEFRWCSRSEIEELATTSMVEKSLAGLWRD